MNDREWMLKALTLAERGRITAPPNPWVGCVVVKEGKLISEGWHEKAGGPHAEVVALNEAKELARGADLYVTLEPCCHFGRTPPCTDVILQAKPARVIVGLLDPDPRVSGEGVALLKREGIEVVAGIAKDEIEASLAPYLHHRKFNRPYCIGKAAISLDGRIAAKDGSSKWISSASARKDAHRLRAESQAIIVGSGTFLKDQPQLTARDYPTSRQPLRIVLGDKDKIAEHLADQVVSSNIPLQKLLSNLGKEGVLQVLVEGGSKVLGSFLKEGLIDKLVLYVAPIVLGQEGVPLFDGLHIGSMEDAIKFSTGSIERFDETCRIDYIKIP